MSKHLNTIGWPLTPCTMLKRSKPCSRRDQSHPTMRSRRHARHSSRRKSGHQAAVSVNDRTGNALVMLRDRFAGPHTVDTAINKAYTAVTFKMDTTAFARATQPGEAASGVRHLPRIVAIGGGLPIESAGSIVGSIGVSGAPGGDADEACAKAGIAAIRDELDF